MMPSMDCEKQKGVQKSIDRKKQPCYANCTNTPNTVGAPTEREVRYGIFYGVYSGDRCCGADHRDFVSYVFKEVNR